MGPLFARRRGRARAVAPSSDRRLALLYGRGLRLPPSPILIHAMSTNGAASASRTVAGHLRPFQQRLHRQRIAVTLVRLLILAGLVIAATLLLYLLGVPMFLPATPLVAGAVVLALGLCTLPWQRPSPAEMAYALDQRLDLRQQIGSALELEADGQEAGRLAPLLRERAVRAMSDAEPAWVLPWPSLQRERWTLACAAAVAGLSAILSLHMRPGPFPFTLSPGQPVAAHRSAAAHHSPQAQAVAPVKVITLGNTGAQRAIPALNARRAPAGARLGGQTAPNGVKAGAGAHFLPGQGRTSRGQSLRTGQGTPSGNNGHAANGQSTPGRTGAGSQTASGQGQSGKGGQSRSLNLRSGKNSSAGGVGSPQQQALTSLQNSIAGSQGQQGKPGTRSASSQQQGAHKSQGTHQGQGSSGRRNGASGKQGQGNGRNGSNSNRSGQGQAGNGRNGQGQRGAGDGSSSFNPSQYGPNGNTSADYEAGRYGSRYGHPGAGSGADQGATTDPNAGSGKGSTANLSGGATIALDGTGNRGMQGARLTVGIGAPNRDPASGGSTLYNGTGRVTVSTPGYVAPDSNDVSSDDSAIVRGYFTPNSN